MGLDIRLPLGLLFLATGGMMTIYGLFTRGSAIYEKSLYMDVNLIWGVVLLLFGLAMLLLGMISRRGTSGVELEQEEPLQREASSNPGH